LDCPHNRATPILPAFFGTEVIMALERTLSIVKPDGVSRNLIGEVYRRFETQGLKVVAARMLRLSQQQAELFYEVHRERPFYKDLVRYMTSGPIVAQVLEGESAIARNREIMGATDPKKAAAGTIRADLAQSIEQNVVHGSDAADTAAREIAFFFSTTEICPR
jgi:nucleoside-diphosphate kinase